MEATGVGEDRPHREAVRRRPLPGPAEALRREVHGEDAEAALREPHRVPPAPTRQVQRPALTGEPRLGVQEDGGGVGQVGPVAVPVAGVPAIPAGVTVLRGNVDVGLRTVG
jgi:hypothetical protein